MDHANSPSMVITSISSAEQHWFCFGLYRWDNEKNCYKQVDSVRSERFLYRARNGSWYISREVGMMKGFMKNPSETTSVPLTGWMYFDSNIKAFYKDPSVKIKFGELTEDDISGKVRVQFQGVLKDTNLEGDYEMTEQYVDGKPTYKNKHGDILHGLLMGWSIFSSEGIIVSKSKTGFCPTQSCTFMGPFPHSMFRGRLKLEVLDEINKRPKRYVNIIITKVSADESPGPVCTSTPKMVSKIRSDVVEMMKIHAEASHEEYLVISGEGSGKQLRGNCLGMYQWDPEHCSYMQVSTEEHPDQTKRKGRYLYQSDDECWYISSDPGKRKGLLKNFSKSSSVPLDGWMFMTNKSKLIKDSSAKIQFGRLPQDDVVVTISVQVKSLAEKKFPNCSGDFIKGSKYYCRRPVYEKNDGMILYCSDDSK